MLQASGCDGILFDSFRGLRSPSIPSPPVRHQSFQRWKVGRELGDNLLQALVLLLNGLDFGDHERVQASVL